MTNAMLQQSVPMIEKARYLRIIDEALKGNRMINTTNLSRQDWLAIRQLLGIGASEASVAMGINRYKTPFHLWQEKVSDAIASFENNFTIWGNLLEEPLAKEYERKTGRKVFVDGKIRIHPKYDNLFASLDRVVTASADEDGFGILECKSTIKRVYQSWIKNEEDCVQGIPLEYYVQIQQQLSVTGASWCDLIIGILDDRDSVIKRIIPDLPYIAKQDLILQTWWNEYVVPMIPPPMNADEFGQVEPAIGSFREADNKILTTFDQLKEAKAQLKGIEKNVEALEDEVKIFLGDNENLTSGGKVICTWKTSYVKRVDNDFLKKNYPDVAEAVTFSKPQRNFRVK